ncbi:hypothetical protein Hanom_Chr16g01468071 [Helianthus anomalus]
MKGITSQLDFGVVLVWYPRAEMVFQKNFQSAQLMSTDNHTGVATNLWAFIAIIYDVE